MTTDDGHTINMAIGTVDGHMAAFRMDDNNRVVASFVDTNDNGEVDDNEVTDLRSENMTLNTLTSGNNNVQMTATTPNHPKFTSLPYKTMLTLTATPWTWLT